MGIAAPMLHRQPRRGCLRDSRQARDLFHGVFPGPVEIDRISALIVVEGFAPPFPVLVLGPNLCSGCLGQPHVASETRAAGLDAGTRLSRVRSPAARRGGRWPGQLQPLPAAPEARHRVSRGMVTRLTSGSVSPGESGGTRLAGSSPRCWVPVAVAAQHVEGQCRSSSRLPEPRASCPGVQPTLEPPSPSLVEAAENQTLNQLRDLRDMAYAVRL